MADQCWNSLAKEAKWSKNGSLPAVILYTELETSFLWLPSFSQVFRPDGGNGYNVFTEEEANIEQKRNKPKKISPRMRWAESFLHQFGGCDYYMATVYVSYEASL